MPQDSNEDGEIVIVGSRRGRPTAQPRLAVTIDIDTGGTHDASDIFNFSQTLRDLLSIQTDFDVDETFTAKQKEIIVKAIQGIANHPLLAAAFADLLTKNVDINIRPVTRPSDQLRAVGDLGATWGLNDDGTVSPGATLDIYIRVDRHGYALSPFQIAQIIVHELVHALGVPAFNDRLDADGSSFDRDLTLDIFRGYDFNAGATVDSGVGGIIAAPDGGGQLVGTGEYEVFSGSDDADTITPGAGGSFIYSGLGDDRIVIDLGGLVDVVRDDGGADRLVISGVNPASVTTRWSDDGLDLAVLVDGVQEAIFENAAGAGALEGIEIDGLLFATSTFSNSVNVAPMGGARHADYFGAFYGGYVGSGGPATPISTASPTGSGPCPATTPTATGASIRGRGQSWAISSRRTEPAASSRS